MRRAWSTIMIGAIGGFFLLNFAVQDLRTPSAVTWESVDVEGRSLIRAAGLILQQERDGVVWASDGFSIYRSKGDRGFLKVHAVKPAFDWIWAAYSRTVRNFLDDHELIEVFPLRSDLLLVFVGGHIHRVDLRTGQDEIVHRLRHFRRGEGHGVMPFGIAADDDGRVYYGEYAARRLNDGEIVAMFRSDDHGRSFKAVHEFSNATLHQIHAVQWDPFAQVLWVSASDGKEQNRVGYSENHGRTFNWIGHDSQEFQARGFVFSETSVDWLSDPQGLPAKVIRWHRDDLEVEISEESLPSQGLYLQDLGGGYRLATTGEDRTGLWLIDQDLDLTSIMDWPVREAEDRSFATIRLARGTVATGDGILISPLRTGAEGAAIYRFPKNAAFAAAGMRHPFGSKLLSRDDP